MRAERSGSDRIVRGGVAKASTSKVDVSDVIRLDDANSFEGCLDLERLNPCGVDNAAL